MKSFFKRKCLLLFTIGFICFCFFVEYFTYTVESETIPGFVEEVEFIPSETTITRKNVIISSERYIVTVKVIYTQKTIFGKQVREVLVPLNNEFYCTIAESGSPVPLQHISYKNIIGGIIKEDFILLEEEPLNGPLEWPYQDLERRPVRNRLKATWQVFLFYKIKATDTITINL